MKTDQRLQLHLAQHYRASIQNFVRYFVQLAKQAQQNNLLLVDEQLENIIQALHLAHAHGLDDLLVSGANATYPLLERRGQFDQANVHLQRAETVARRKDEPQALLETLMHLAQMNQRTGDQVTARGRLAEGIALAESTQTFEPAALLHQELAHLLSGNFELDEAIHHLGEAITYANRLNQRRLLAQLLADRVWLSLLRTGGSEPTIWLQEVLAVLPGPIDPPLEMLFQGQLGITLALHLRADEAIHALSESLRIARMLNDIPGISFALSFLGVISLHYGQFADAEREWSEAHELARRTGLAWLACFTLCRLGEMENWRGNYAQARHYLDEGLGLAEQFSDTLVEQRRDLITTYADWSIRRNLLFQAERQLDQAMSLARLLNRPYSSGQTLLVYGHLRMQQANWTAAERVYGEALDVALKSEIQSIAAYAKIGIGKARHAQGDIDTARRLVTESLIVLEPAKDFLYVTAARHWLASLDKE